MVAMTKFFFKLVLFVIFLLFTYGYFSKYGYLHLRVFDFDITTSVSFAAVAIILFVTIISYISLIFRFIANLPNAIASAYGEMKDRKAREILFEVSRLKEVGEYEQAAHLFRKHQDKLVRKKYNLIPIFNYKFNKHYLEDDGLHAKFIELAHNKLNTPLLLEEFILPNFRGKYFATLEMFASEIGEKKECQPAYFLVKAFIALKYNEYEESIKFAKKSLSLGGITEEIFAKVKAEILCAKASKLIEEKEFKKADKLLIEAFSTNNACQKITALIAKIPKSSIDKKQYNSIIEKQWKSLPTSDLINCYLAVNSDTSQGQMLELTEKLLKINDNNAAKITIATEYLIHGFDKQANNLLKDIEPNKYPESLKKAQLFREALSTELKMEKITKFRDLIFNNYVR